MRCGVLTGNRPALHGADQADRLQAGGFASARLPMRPTGKRNDSHLLAAGTRGLTSAQKENATKTPFVRGVITGASERRALPDAPGAR